MNEGITLNYTHALVAGGSSLLKKLLIQQNINHTFFPTFMVFSLSEKNSTTIFFFGWKTKISASPIFLAQVYKNMFRGLLSSRDIQWMKLTKRPHNNTKFYVFEKFSGVRKWRNSSSGSHKTKIFIYKVPFIHHLLVELFHNSTNAKEQKNWTGQCLQKRASK